MLPSDRLTSAVREHGKSLIIAGTDRLTSAIHGRKMSLVYVGAALAVASAGSASAATVAASAATPLAATPISATAARAGSALHPAAPLALTGPHAAVRQFPADPHAPAAHGTGRAWHRGTGRSAARHASSRRWHAVTWQQVRNELNWQTNPAAAAHRQVPFADRLAPVGISGSQSWMPVGPAQVSNATTIVRQALDKKMGVRSAVIAVATAMQESKLLDLGYGTGDSLGLFQQQWDMGWGTPAQIMNPRYSAGAFLGALRQYQAADPAWAAQPLWQAAQGVQKSAFPYAYAQWEAQACQLVRQIATRIR